ncbi:MAG: penicillin-binding protein 2 [Candidatus Marinimicrobia bacterium]|nr:penicillin-binding protein 2 [Candidatus Neomarinimicrobiota bacterium]
MKSIENKISSGRRNFLISIVIFLFIVLFVRMYNLQVMQYNKFIGIANSNRIRVLPTEAPRGIIYDRNGKIIADNKFQYNINVIPFEFDQDGEACEKVAQLLEITPETIRKRIRNNWRGRFLPTKIAEDVDIETLTRIQEHKLELPGVIYTLEPLRSFPSEARLSHTIGYLREVNPKEIEKAKDFKYQQGDLIGYIGVEKQYENILRGQRGVKYIQVNAWGQAVGNFPGKDEIPAIPGKDLYLTIELGLQKLNEELMKDKPGATIIMNPENGEIYSMVSSPDYSPNFFSGIISPADFALLRDNPDKPLINRITNGLYPPGSTFKMIAAIAALENNIIDKNHTFFCNGKYRLGRREFKCWNEYGHGNMDMKHAIEQSCNVYFYNLIRRMDIDIWASYVKLFGFGQKTGIDLPNEYLAVWPDSRYLDKKYGKNQWTEGHKLNQVIGQGDVTATPIQLARYAAIMSTKGKIIQPHLGMKYKEKDHFVLIKTQADSVSEISNTTWTFVHEAMSDVVYANQGTGKQSQVDGMRVFGKTGTAQNAGEDHAWFVGWAENDSIKIAFASIYEHGGHGGSASAPIVRELIEYCKNNVEKFK